MTATAGTWLEGLQDLFDENPGAFRAALSPITLEVACGADHRGSEGSKFPSASIGLSLSSTESLVRVLLGIDEIQARLLEVLLEKLPLYDEEADDSNSTKRFCVLFKDSMH